jgi:hypothetical protein
MRQLLMAENFDKFIPFLCFYSVIATIAHMFSKSDKRINSIIINHVDL